MFLLDVKMFELRSKRLCCLFKFNVSSSDFARVVRVKISVDYKNEIHLRFYYEMYSSDAYKKVHRS